MAYTFKHGDRPLDGITIQRAVGRGGFGEVYYALTDSGKQVAVKYLRDNPEVELRGIAHVMNLKSPHLITIYDVRDSEEGEPFVIMEYVSGPSLRDLLIAEPSGLGPQKAAFFVKGIAQGLTYLHERGIVHRDLKPGNIFYDDGYVKIGDYGLSKHIAVSAHSGNTISVGTVHYMAPEIGSGTYSKTIDVYALGVMLYEMLTGRLPFTGSSMGEVLMRHLSDTPDISGIPEPFADVIATALQKDPTDRFQDVDELLDRLMSITEINDGLASFDASVLVDTPRANAIDDPDRTLTRSPKPVPVMDAREADLGLPPIPPIPPVLGEKKAKKARKLEQKARKLSDKASRKVAAVRARIEAMGGSPRGTGAKRPLSEADYELPPRSKWQQFFIGLITIFAVAGALGALTGDGVVFGTSLLFIGGGAFGTLIAYRLCKRRGSAEYSLQERVLFGACTLVCMLPGFAAGQGSGLGRIVFALAAVFVLFNWIDRIETGRRFVISGGTVFWHAVGAWIIGEMVSNGEYGILAGVIGAAQVVAVQTFAGMWPLGVSGSRLGAQDWQRQRPHARRSDAYERVEKTLERAGDALGAVVDTAGAQMGRVFGGKQHAPEVNEEDAKPTAEPPSPALTPEIATVVQQPSFVGRTANAGLSFLAKLMLLAGLTAAIVVNTDIFKNDAGFYGVRNIIEQTGAQVTIGDVRVPQSRPNAAPAVFVPLLLGSVLLIVSRRNDGIPHFLRGFFGCMLAVLTAILAFGPLADDTALFLAGDWDALIDGDRWGVLVPNGFFLMSALLLLFWPRKNRYQGQKPIII